MSTIDPHAVTRPVCFSDEEDGAMHYFSIPAGTNISDTLQDPATGHILHHYTESEPCAHISDPASQSLAQNVLTIEQQFSNPVGGNPFPNASPVTQPCNFVPMYNANAVREQECKYIVSTYLKKAPLFERGKRISKCDSIEIVGSASFSELFHSTIGTNNTVNIYGPDNTSFRIRLFAANVEYEALRQHIRNENKHMEILFDCLTRHYNGQWHTPNGLQWYFFFGGKIVEGAGYVKLIQVFFNCSRNDAIWTLAYMVGIDFEKMFTTYATHLMAENDVIQVPDDTIPELLFEIVDGKYELFASRTALYYHQGNSLQTIGVITTYQRGETTFCLPATVGRRELSIGRYQSGTFLLNQHLFYDTPDATILFFADTRTALVCSNRLTTSSEADARNFIATACLTDDPAVIPWSHLSDRNVIFIPAPTKASLATVKRYKNKFEGALVQSFKVYPFPVLHSQPDFSLSKDIPTDLDSVEKILLENAFYISAEESITTTVMRISCSALEYMKYVDWGREHGIFRLHGNAGTGNDIAQIFPATDFLGKDFGDGVDPSLEYDYSKGFDFMLLLGVITLLHGLKDAGKSLEVLRMIQMALMKAKVFLFDFETPPNVYISRLKQLGLLEHRNSKFYDFVKLTVDSEHPWDNFELKDAEYQKQARDEIRTKGVQLAIFDNVLSSDDTNANTTDKAAASVMAFSSKLIMDKVGVLLVHHTLSADNPKARGSVIWTTRVQTEIHLIGREEIVENKFGTPEVQALAQQDGSTVGLHVRSCKTSYQLKDKVFWYHHAAGARYAKYLGCTQFHTGEIIYAPGELASADCYSPAGQMPEGKPAVEPCSEGSAGDVPSLSHTAKRILTGFRGKEVSRSEIDNFVACSENTSRKYLAELIEAGCAESVEDKKGLYRIL